MSWIISSKILDLNAEVRAIDEQIKSETDTAKVEDLQRKRKCLRDVALDLLDRAVYVPRKRKKKTT